MAGIGNNLYPPIFKKAYLPAFVGNSDYRIYFSLSIYNSLNDISGGNSADRKGPSHNVGAQISIQNQNTNYSALDPKKYPAGIKTMDVQVDFDRKTQDKYYVIISSNDLVNGYTFGQYYKVQIRFTDTSASDPGTTGPIPVSWFTQNLLHFSEWSQVVLIKPLSKKPRLKINSFSGESNDVTFALKTVDIIGNVSFQAIDNGEYLKKYRIYLYNSENVLLEDSGQFLMNSYSNLNQIKYKIKRDLKDNNSYKLVIKLQTNNLYEWQEEFNFTLKLVQFTTLDPNDISIVAQPDDKAGWIKCSITSLSPILKLGTNLIIKRKSSKDNFTTWEEMNIFLVKMGNKINYTWYDRTVESGVWYYYGIEQVNLQGFRSNDIVISSPVMCLFEDIFLLNKDYQLKIRFNPQVSNYSHVVSESLTQTIGSKYPFIRRNGNTNYRTFSLSGTISFFMDLRENGMKAFPQDLYGNSYSFYNNQNINRNINDFRDSIREKDFREKVISFLYENDVKLYKSTTEGNILVKLMNISFTPNNTLSRHIYDFTCTAQEVDQFNFQNCSKYNIQTKGQYIDETNIVVSKYGQIITPDYNSYYLLTNDEEIRDAHYPYDKRKLVHSDNKKTFEPNVNIISKYITPKYRYLETDQIEIKAGYLTNLKIQLTSAPYPIKIQNGNYVRCTGEQETDVPVLIGHIIKINQNDIIIGKEGIYEILDPNIKITSIIFPEKETGTISYLAAITESQKLDKIATKYQNIEKIGQLHGSFTIGSSIYTKIYKRYLLRLSNSTRQLQKIKGLRIYAEPNTVFYIKDSQDKNFYNKFVIGETGLLEFYDNDGSPTGETDIKGIYPIGVKLKKCEIQKQELDDDEYYQDPIVYENTDAITNPKKNHVYTIQDNQTITIYKTELKDLRQENMKAWQLRQGENMIYDDLEAIILFLENQDFKLIYYHGGWYLFREDTVILPIEVIIDYYCNILRKEYQTT